MKLATSLLLPALVPYVAAAAIFGGNQQILNDEMSVPGENVLDYCSADDNYSLKITKVDLDPNPPKK